MELFDFSESSRRRLVSGFVGFGVLAVAMGFCFGEKGYFGGFLAGVSANSFAVAFGLWAVDRYAQARKRAEWGRVHGWAVAEVMFTLWNLASEADWLLRLGGPGLGALLELQPDRPDQTAAALKQLSDTLKRKAEPLGNETEPEEEFVSTGDALERFLTAAAPLCSDLERVFLPVLLQSGADPVLIEGLMRFGQKHRKITALRVHKGATGVEPRILLPQMFREVVELLDRGAQLYEVAQERKFRPPTPPDAPSEQGKQDGGPSEV